MPTSVLLAVLTAAGLLALAPALVRRYDATERLVAERAQSTARVLDRRRRRRTVPVSGRPLFASLTPPLSTSVGLSMAGPPSVGPEEPVAGSPESTAATVEASTSESPASAERSTDDGVRPVSELGQAVWLQVDGRSGPLARTGSSPIARTSPSARATAPVRAGSSPRMAARPGATQRRFVESQPNPKSSGKQSQPAPKSQPLRRSPLTAKSQPTRRSQAARRAQARRGPGRSPQAPAVYRRRRVLAGLILLNVIELVGVTTVSPGFWTGFAVTLMLLVGYVVHLRNSALADSRSRRIEVRHAAVIAAKQAEVRASHARRLVARREALRRAAAARAAAQRDAQQLSQRYVDHDPQRGARVRGRSYETGRGYDERAAGF